FDGGAQSGNGGMVVSARLKFLSIHGISDFALGDEVGRLYIPAANDRRVQQVTPAFPDKQNSCAGRAEHPLLCARREKIDLVKPGGKGAERLYGVDRKQGPSL